MQTYPGQMYPPVNQAKTYIAQLHHVTFTYHRMQTHPLLIGPRATEPDYTGSVLHIVEYRHTPANPAYTYRAKLHQVTFTYTILQTCLTTPKSCSPLQFHLLGDMTFSTFASSFLIAHRKTSVTDHTTPLKTQQVDEHQASDANHLCIPL